MEKITKEKTAEGVKRTAERVFERVLGVKSATNDVYNVDGILHFVQNDTLFFGNDREKTAEGVFETAEEVFERVLGMEMTKNHIKQK